MPGERTSSGTVQDFYAYVRRGAGHICAADGHAPHCLCERHLDVLGAYGNGRLRVAELDSKVLYGEAWLESVNI
jgi:hypothetical protein